MKKLIALAVTLAISLCLFGCGGNENDKDDPGNNDITKNPDGSIDLPIIDVDFD